MIDHGVANLLGISLKTVESHRTSAMNKLGLGSSAALVHYAVRTQIVEADDSGLLRPN
jgi:DNA-binding CsgD family transcriptional regulator